MVVVCAAVLTKSGRVLLARAFVELSKLRLDGYLQTFPKLVGPDSQHTFIETDSIRYVYQPMESIYVLLITTKNSNIMEDLETLRLFSKLLPVYCGGQSEDAVMMRVFELSFAVDELLTHGGYRENVTLQQIKTFTEMDSHEEKLQKIITDSKHTNARAEANRKANDIDTQKAVAKQQMMAGGGGGGGRYASYGNEGARDHDHAPAPRYEAPEPSPRKKAPEPSSSSSSSTAGKGKVKGMQLSKAKKQDDFFSMVNKEEKLVTPKPGPAGSAASASAAGSASSATAAKQSVRVLIDEKVLAVLDKEGGVKKLEIKGEIKLSIFDPDDSKILLLTNSALQEKDGYKCRLHPKINKALWASHGQLGLADATKAFPVGSDNAPIIVKWRKESTSEDDVPLSLNFWPNVEDGQTVVSVEYSAERAKVPLQRVQISIPCASREPPEVTSVAGDFKFDAQKKMLHWRIPTISEENQNGALEFSVPEMDGDDFFPITVTFESSSTLSQIAVTGVVQAEAQDQPVEYDVETQVSTEKYTVE